MKKIILKSAVTKETAKKRGGGVFYTLLFAAIVIVGTTAYVIRTGDKLPDTAVSNQPQLSNAVVPKIPVPVNAPTSEKVNNELPLNTVPENQWQSDDVIPIEENTEETVSASEPEKENAPINSVIMPVEGEILKIHSDTQLSYSKTMGDWRLHKGVDIRAPIGATVTASALGTVSECYEDTSHGITIIIDHGSGVFTKYSNLASSQMVKPGQIIAEGEAIAVVGDTAEFEIADEAHIHFEIIKDGISVNPEDYFR